MGSVIKMGIITLTILLIYSFITWLLFGKEDDYKKDVISIYEAPKELSSMFVSYILKKNKILSFELFYIGVLSLIEKGFLTVEDTAIFDEKKNSSIFLYFFPPDKENMEVINCTLNKELISDTGYRRKVLFEEEEMLLDALSDKENVFYGKLNELFYEIKRNFKDKYKSRYNKKRLYKGNKMFLIPFVLAVTAFGVFACVYGKEDGILLLIIFPILFWVIIFSLLDISVIFSSLLSIPVKIICGIIFLFFTCQTFLLALEIIFSVGLPSLIPILITALFIIYIKVLGKYTPEGIEQLKIIEGIRKYIKSQRKMIFNKEEDLINHFRTLLSYTAAMNVEKETLELIEKDIEISIFKERRDYIREKLCINYYENRKEYEKEYIKYIFPKIYR